eukprot:NODE_8115_length_532_cov_4.115942_g7062_i0.p3 GENE.NODE_8115_length_532_cov_4.115942_g7062_i0~~NODE_8115_length_532_cov_4.115942_g7062_i0.p3  ORF type:complete len:50 (-),score=2.08 NODE_8115_length_532_cov_4.115942_g7062_i0:91-240(-)
MPLHQIKNNTIFINPQFVHAHLPDLLPNNKTLMKHGSPTQVSADLHMYL